MTVTVTDLFCGAGGSSLGAEAAGATLVMAANHWSTAIEVHQSHFPNAGHDCADISQADPRRYPRSNILLASPECTNHSQARGISRKRQDPSLWDAPDPKAERSRATMWDVPRFAEQMHYDAVVVENVVEATKWVQFPAWWMAMELLGYVGRTLSHNSMHHGVPQSRDRIYIVWTRPGLNPDLEFEQLAWCPRCQSARPCRQQFKQGRRVGRYRQQWLWGCTTCGAVCEPPAPPAASIIDWSLDCPRIGGRSRPLAAATRARILAGLQRYGWAPVTTSGAGNVYERTPGNRARSVDEPLPVQQTTATTALATPPGFLFQAAHGGRINDLGKPHATVCASDDRQALVLTNRINAVPRPAAEPITTVVAGGNHHALLMRNNTGGEEMVTPIGEPARTMTTAGHQSLLLPNRSHQPARPVDQPAPSCTTTATVGLVDLDAIVDDCGFRMLEPYEVAAAMSFPVGYIPRSLPKKDQVKLAGNAVTPPAMTWIVGRLVQSLESAA
jgi:DNA (cytosine-5)-methyltransferase 1